MMSLTAPVTIFDTPPGLEVQHGHLHLLGGEEGADGQTDNNGENQEQTFVHGHLPERVVYKALPAIVNDRPIALMAL
jgi:hypothetical protein